MSKFKQICRSLLGLKKKESGRYQALVTESYRHSPVSHALWAFAKNEDDIIRSVKRRTKDSYAHKIEITDVFYRASKYDIARACLSEKTKQAIDAFNKNGDKQDINLCL